MSKLNRLQKILIAIIAFFVILGVILRSVSGNLTSNLAYDGISMLKYALIDHPVQTVKNWTNDLGNLWAAKEENDQLKYLLSTMPSIQAENDELKRQTDELRAMLELQKNEDRFVMINADVLSRDKTYWNNEITINKGSKDGIKENMAVRSVKGMVGKVISCSDNTSVVKLLTSQDKQNNVAVVISISADQSVEGVLQSYDASRGAYIVQLFNNSDEIKQGMQVVSSGKGGGYPGGLLVGNVDTVQALNNQTGQTVYVTPIEDFQTFNVVAVVGEK